MTLVHGCGLWRCLWRARAHGWWWRIGLPVVAVFMLPGCSGHSPISKDRLERSIAATFSNLLETQVSWLQLPAMTAAEVGAKAACHRLSGPGPGAGEWVCTLIWMGPKGQAVRDVYDLFVATDGCYAASIAGENFGGPILRTTGGKDMRNLLYAFDGCFDTT
jgi:hypothetical protein